MATFTSIITVLTPSPTVDLTVLSTVKEELGIDPTDTSKDTMIARWITESSAQVETYLNRTLGRQRVSEAMSLRTDSRVYGIMHEALASPIRLTRWPVALVETVTEGTAVLDPTTVTGPEYEVDYDTGLIYRLNSDGYRTSWRDPKVVVVYQAGYVLLGELPNDIERACIQLMRYRYYANQRDPSIRSESLAGVYSVGYATATPGGGKVSTLPDDVEAMLEAYRDTPL